MSKGRSEGDSASRQAVTSSNAKQASKQSLRTPTQRCNGEGRRRGDQPPRLGDSKAEQPHLHGSAGVVATACGQGEQTQHGRPTPAMDSKRPSATGRHQPDAREGQAGPGWESDRPIVPRKRVTTAEGRGLS
jgi:hypothetical protein